MKKEVKEHYIEVEPNEIFPKGAIVTWSIARIFHLSRILEAEHLNEEEKIEVASFYMGQNYDYFCELKSSIKEKDLEEKIKFEKNYEEHEKKYFEMQKELFKNAEKIINASDDSVCGKLIFEQMVRLYNCENKEFYNFSAITHDKEEIEEAWKNMKKEQDYEFIKTNNTEEAMKYLKKKALVV